MGKTNASFHSEQDLLRLTLWENFQTLFVFLRKMYTQTSIPPVLLMPLFHLIAVYAVPEKLGTYYSML